MTENPTKHMKILKKAQNYLDSCFSNLTLFVEAFSSSPSRFGAPIFFSETLKFFKKSEKKSQKSWKITILTVKFLVIIQVFQSLARVQSETG